MKRQFSKEHREKLRKAKLGVRQTKEHVENRMRKIRGAKHWKWKGDEVGYRSLHYWVQNRLGNPSFCEGCKRTKSPEGLGKNRSYFHWANISGKYKRNVNDWRRLCYRCHYKFDHPKK